MQDRVTPQNPEFSELIVQYNNGHMTVGLGLEPTGNMHFIDAIYGGIPTQTEIGKIFHGRMKEVGLDDPRPDFRDSYERDEFYDKLGRLILDSVTGSNPSGPGVWTWLDRPSVNRLIRILRKARDAAFGRDE